ncbi:hypothetical protein K3728_06115 [Rhodobacteraceae bacterium M385]|nr:hypothetical protein K3728_06115 [Rhodobacteraceae bacterium M385]
MSMNADHKATSSNARMTSKPRRAGSLLAGVVNFLTNEDAQIELPAFSKAPPAAQVRPRLPLTPPRPASECERVNAAAGRKIDNFILLDEELLAERDIIVVAPRETSALINNVDWLADRAASYRVVTTLEEATKGLCENMAEHQMIFCDIDAFTDKIQAIDALRDFRNHYPSVSLIIGSRTFSRNDFSTDRGIIGDVSLRLPAGRPAVALAVNASPSNNRELRRRGTIGYLLHEAPVMVS